MSKLTKITIGRLYNLGRYEHVRYDLTVEVADGESARDALVGLEKIVEALKPEKSCCVSTRSDLDQELHSLEGMKHDLAVKGAEEFKRGHGFFKGTPEEYLARVEKSYSDNIRKRVAYELRAREAREMLDRIGGASKWKDAKLDWESDYNDEP